MLMPLKYTINDIDNHGFYATQCYAAYSDS